MSEKILERIGTNWWKAYERSRELKLMVRDPITRAPLYEVERFPAGEKNKEWFVEARQISDG